jgi:hypothetical protein
MQTDGTVLVGKRENGTFTSINTTAAGFYTQGTDITFWLIDNQMTIIKNDIPEVIFDLTDFDQATRHGFARGGSNNNPKFDYAEIIPINDNPINSAVSYTATKSNTLVIQKNQWSPYDSGGVAGQDIFDIGSTRYMTFAIRDNNGDFNGISYATEGVTPNTWNRVDTKIIDAGSKSISNSSSYWDGTFLHMVYCNRLTGIIYYAKGTAIDNLVEQGEIINLTSQNIFCRHPDILVHKGVWYVYYDTRFDQAAGEFGAINVCSGVDLNSLSDHKEILSTPHFKFGMCDIGTPSVRYNSSNEYFEMLHMGYRGGAFPYVHETGLAICKTPNGKFEAVSSTPLIANGGSGSIDEVHVHDPSWYPDGDVVYYTANDALSGSTDSYDGITYATLT